MRDCKIVKLKLGKRGHFFLNMLTVLFNSVYWHRGLTLNIPSLGRQRCLPSWGPWRTPWFLVISQLFDAVDYLNYVFWVSETIIQWFKHC